MHIGQLGERELLLLPQPHAIDFLGGTVDLPQVLTFTGAPADLVRSQLGSLALPTTNNLAQRGATLRIIFDNPLDAPGGRTPTNEQRYALHIAEPEDSLGPKIRLSSPSLSGIRLGLSTLAQLLRRFAPTSPAQSIIMPAMLIRDEPAFAYRGIMLDVSRDRVPRMEELISTIDTLASLKINHIQLYTEHTFAYAGHETVWRNYSPITGDQIRRLDQHCKLKGVELAANQNCFGHLHHWLNHEQYAHYSEIPPGGSWHFAHWPRQGPWSVCPTDPRVPSFIEGLLDQLLPNFSSPLINIGCDEVYDIAYGRSKNEVAKRGRGVVYFDFVRKVARMCKDRKRTPMFWADMLESHADLLAMVPEDMISLVWGYEPSHDFAGILRRLSLANRQAWVCPGTSSWLSHFGRTSERLGNIKAAVEQGHTHGAEGVLTCDWGDQGHRQQPSVSMLGMALGADASWNPRTVDTHSLAAASLHALHDRTLQAASWMATLGDIDLPLRKTCLGLSRPDQTGQLQNASALFVDAQLSLTSGKDVGDLSLWRSVASSLATQRVPAGLAPRLHDELSHSLDCARFAATRALARRFPAGLTSAGAKVLLDQLDIIMLNHRRLWNISSRPGGLDNSLSHYQRSLKELQAIAS